MGKNAEEMVAGTCQGHARQHILESPGKKPAIFSRPEKLIGQLMSDDFVRVGILTMTF